MPVLPTDAYNLTIEKEFVLSPAVLYWAWTTGFDRWIAMPGTHQVHGVNNTSFTFDADFLGNLHTYKGLFLKAIPDRVVEILWQAEAVSGPDTLITVKFQETVNGSKLELIHDGFLNELLRDVYGEAWGRVFLKLEAKLILNT